MTADQIFEELKKARPSQDSLGKDWKTEQSMAYVKNSQRSVREQPSQFDVSSHYADPHEDTWRGTSNITYGNIGAGASVTRDVSVTGVSTSADYSCSVSPSTALPDGIVVADTVPGSAIVSVRLFNTTAGTINVTNRNYTVTANLVT